MPRKNTRAQQLGLWLEAEDGGADDVTVAPVEARVTYNKIHVSQSTFKAGLAAQVHRWFRLTPSFGPDLVQEMLTSLQCASDEVVLDPFAGASTTLIECQLDGIASVGFELNPFLHFVGQTSLNWSLDTQDLRRHLDQMEQRFREIDDRITPDNMEANGYVIPSIHDPFRWWRPDVLKQLLIIKALIQLKDMTEAQMAFFRLGLAGVLVPDLTNVTLGRLQLHFIDRSKDDIHVWSTYAAHMSRMIDDLDALHKLELAPTSKVLLQDSTNLDSLQMSRRVDCVVTSPPYPNRYSYVWNTRPHLYMLDFFGTAKQASDLDKAAIGGTWGTATSVLAKGVVAPKFQAVEEAVGPLVEQIRERDNLMANYAMKYFNMLATQIVAMDRFLSPDARAAYVVGCSWLKDVYIETDVLLGELFEGLGLGYRVSSIERIRSRHSGKDLHESIVYAWKRQ